jgi:hypothetical protein
MEGRSQQNSHRVCTWMACTTYGFHQQVELYSAVVARGWASESDCAAWFTRQSLAFAFWPPVMVSYRPRPRP